jgi:hypothetical protein
MSSTIESKLAKLADGEQTKSATFMCQECGHVLKLKGLYGESIHVIDGEPHKDCGGAMKLTRLSLRSK